MIVEFRCDITRPRLWMSRPVLSDEFSTQIAWAETGVPPLAGLEALFELERILLRKGATCFADPLKDTLKEPRRTDRSDEKKGSEPAHTETLARTSSTRPTQTKTPTLTLTPTLTPTTDQSGITAGVSSNCDSPAVR